MRRRGLAVLVGERERGCLPVLVGSGLTTGWGGGLDLTISRTAILTDDVRILQITGISPGSSLEEKSVPVQEGRSRSGETWMWAVTERAAGVVGAPLRVRRGFVKSLLGQ